MYVVTDMARAKSFYVAAALDSEGNASMLRELKRKD